ncbi:hypothetical protein EB837_23600 [Kluyvera ascorbata]|uniref:Bacteriophage CI repressor N-terminal domain-containing protein n=1 Tax=Kluyvera ascorbata TaxID=51288 RepID=A0A3N2RQU9_9ENTR|nr:helix-turn-helix domain-containing protein [Kluyvera ascorbata]ROU09844.1 hypothetical protein EB837_23600 [Kluyvera ascorbata]
MKQERKSDFAISDEDKESIASRIRKLIGHRTVRAAAADWGLAFSTLNNYLTRGTEPSLNVAIKISHMEGVPLEWLATGIVVDEVHKGNIDGAKGLKLEENASHYIGFTGTPAQSGTQNDEHLSLAWSMIYQALTRQQRATLVSLFMRMGANGVIEKLTDESERETSWEMLTTEDKERLLRLNEQLKKGSSEADLQAAEAGLASSDKKAG